MLTETSPEGYAGCGEAIAALDLRPLLPACGRPTLVVSGAEDVAAPPSVGAATARAIPGARLAVIQAASHFAHYEKPGPVTDALLRHFLATAVTRLPGSPAADGHVADHRRRPGQRGGPHPVSGQDASDRAGDPRVAARGGVQAAVRARRTATGGRAGP